MRRQFWSLSLIYEWARGRGNRHPRRAPDDRGCARSIVAGYNTLVEESVATARVCDYEGVPVRVVDPKHLIALALQAGGARRHERAWQLLQVGGVNREQLRTILTRHTIAAEIPDDVSTTVLRRACAVSTTTRMAVTISRSTTYFPVRNSSSRRGTVSSV
jgi:hypothetical protein